MTEMRDITPEDIERALERGRQERSRALCAGLAMLRRRLRDRFSARPNLPARPF